MNSSEIKELRKMLKLSQEAFGTTIGVSKGTILNYEKGGIVPLNKIRLLEKIKDEYLNSPAAKNIYLEKNGTRFELVELVDHFVKNADDYFEQSEYLQLWHKNKVEDLLGDRLRDLGILGEKED